MGAERAQLFGDRLHVRVTAATDAGDLARLLEREGMTPASVRAVTPTLEDVFIERVTRTPPASLTQDKGHPS